NIITVMEWSIEQFDTNNNFDLGTERFTPTISGMYLFNASAYCTDADACAVYIYKNGSMQSNNYVGPADNGSAVAQASTVLYMNGSTDYVDARAYSRNGTTINGNAGYTNFS